VPEQRAWPSKALAEDILADIAGVRAYTAGLVHGLTADESRPERSALVEVVGQLDDLVLSVRARLGVPSVLREPAGVWPEVQPGPGLVTADVVRRMRKNSGGQAKHRARP
jgi:hypothetical protein